MLVFGSFICTIHTPLHPSNTKWDILSQLLNQKKIFFNIFSPQPNGISFTFPFSNFG